VFATRGFRVLLFMAEPSGCPFSRLRGIPGRCIIQAPDSAPEGTCAGFRRLRTLLE
jgi:hypothetical protein